jgi:hypothetical protein
MALAATTIWEVETGGSDTLNGGAFDPGQAGMLSDGAATVANTSAPVFTSASYNFVAGDVGAWLYIASGSNWTPGWYKIASVAANAATLQGTIGLAVLSNGFLSTVVGCATVASPTAATWTIDYSQRSAAQFAYTDLVSAGTGLTVSSVLKPFAKQQVGNSIVITGGTNFNTGRYVIASVAAAIATVVGPTNITTGAGASGTGGLGGALLTLSSVINASPLEVAGNIVYGKTGPFNELVTVAPIATIGANIRLIGYGTTRGDGVQVTIDGQNTRAYSLQWSVALTYWSFENLILSGGTSANINLTATSSKLRFVNCRFTKGSSTPANAIFSSNSNNLNNSTMDQCEFDNFSGTVLSNALSNLTIVRCYFHDCSAAVLSRGFGGNRLIARCVFYNITGVCFGEGGTNSQDTIDACMFHSCGASPINITGDNQFEILVQNNIFSNNTGWGVSGNSSEQNNPNNVVLRNNAFYSNSSGTFQKVFDGGGNITLTASPYVSAPTNFGLNTTVGGGAACRAAGVPGAFPGLGSTIGALDIGAVQHADPAGGGSGISRSRQVMG